ncbi:MAG: hypothetical protein QOH34_3598 [Mycobacterium sp.]|nr:hypothetical protein [Mycobacterium sp.]
MPNPGFVTDRVDATVVEPSDAPGVEPSETDSLASDRLTPSGANPRNTTSLSVLATPSYMDHQSQFSLGQGLVLACVPGSIRMVRERAAASVRVLTPSLVNRLCTWFLTV